MFLVVLGILYLLALGIGVCVMKPPKRAAGGNHVGRRA